MEPWEVSRRVIGALHAPGLGTAKNPDQVNGGFGVIRGIRIISRSV
jgi:hypothetical protein